MVQLIKYLLACLIGYFTGSIAPSYFVGKAMMNIDIREHGSGNAGTTNTLRVLGVKAGVIVFVCDILKGALAAWIGLKLTNSLLGGMLAGSLAVAGHNWPVFLNFKGGKGIASSFGLLLVLFPKIALILFLVEIAVIYFTRYVSLGSIIASSLLPFLLIIFREPWELVLLGTILALIAVIRHRDNISRLLKGEENKIGRSGKRGR
jgi:glycerol-3-phosphate acyltransferase PlsY